MRLSRLDRAGEKQGECQKSDMRTGAWTYDEKRYTLELRN